MSDKRNLYAVILAGGSGTRFWPMSRQKKPKQFLNITGKGTLLQETVGRVQSQVPGVQTFIVTNAHHKREIQKQTKPYGIPPSNILLEPKGKNTAPAVCWAAAHIHRKNPQAIMVVLPSDHLILNKKKFLRILDQAVVLAGQNYLVALGIVPTRPETGYGYLKTINQKRGNQTVVSVQKFTEKPDLATAKKFIKIKNYFWNSGMFIWKTSVILKEFQRHLPVVHDGFVKGTDHAHVRKIWNTLPSISIDYGILEKAGRVAALPAPDIGWSDLGSWESLVEILPRDKEANILKGDILQLQCENSLIWGHEKLIAAIGLKDTIVIDSPDALLICRKDLSQQVREIVSALQKTRRPEV